MLQKKNHNIYKASTQYLAHGQHSINGHCGSISSDNTDLVSVLCVTLRLTGTSAKPYHV